MALDSSDKPQIQFWGTENKFLNNQELGGALRTMQAQSEAFPFAGDNE